MCNNAHNFNKLAFLLRLGVFLMRVPDAIFRSRTFRLQWNVNPSTHPPYRVN